MIDKKLQADIYEWKVANFGFGNVNHQLMGVVEEYGELTHAVLKCQQGIRAIDIEQQKAMAKDAIGDMMIFLLNYLSEFNIEFKMNVYDLYIPDREKEADDKIIFRLAKPINDLCQTHLEFFELNETVELTDVSKILIECAALSIIRVMHYFCYCNDWDLTIVVMDTWEIVKKRDWNKHKETGGEDAK